MYNLKIARLSKLAWLFWLPKPEKEINPTWIIILGPQENQDMSFRKEWISPQRPFWKKCKLWSIKNHENIHFLNFWGSLKMQKCLVLYKPKIFWSSKMLTIFYLFWLTQTRICHYQTTTRTSEPFLRPRLLRDSRSQTLQILLALKIAKLFMIYFRRGWHLRILGRSLGEFYLQVPSNLKCTNKIWLDVENIYEIYRVSVKKKYTTIFQFRFSSEK